MGVQTLTFTELQTLAAEIELVLNNRPIGVDFEDDNEEVLTPNHLIYGRKLFTTGEKRVNIELPDNEENLGRRKRHIEKIVNHFWERWRREYITLLREVQRRSHKHRSEEIEQGDIKYAYYSLRS